MCDTAVNQVAGDKVLPQDRPTTQLTPGADAVDLSSAHTAADDETPADDYSPSLDAFAAFQNRSDLLPAEEEINPDFDIDREEDEQSTEGFAALSDETLVELSHEGNIEAQEYLINKYKNFVRAKARSYFLIGADKEDIIQEGMIGLYKSIRDYKPDKLSSFRAFAELCVTRQIITAIKTATRQKHIPLNSYISLNKPIYDEDSDRTLLDVLSGTRITDPEELIISREDFDDIESKMGEILSSLEWRVLMYYLEGKSYQDIAAILDRHVKSIDNALQRVKRKLERYLEARDKEDNKMA